MWEVGVSEPHFCFASEPLLGSANRGRQRGACETGGRREEASVCGLCLSAPLRPRCFPAAAAQSSLSILAKSVSLHLTQEPTALPTRGLLKDLSVRCLASPPSSETGAPPARRSPLLRCLSCSSTGPFLHTSTF